MTTGFSSRDSSSTWLRLSKVSRSRPLAPQTTTASGRILPRIFAATSRTAEEGVAIKIKSASPRASRELVTSISSGTGTPGRR